MVLPSMALNAEDLKINLDHINFVKEPFTQKNPNLDTKIFKTVNDTNPTEESLKDLSLINFEESLKKYEKR